MDEGEPVVHVHKLVYQIKAGLTKWQVGPQSSTIHLHGSLKGALLPAVCQLYISCRVFHEKFGGVNEETQ